VFQLDVSGGGVCIPLRYVYEEMELLTNKRCSKVKQLVSLT